MFLKQLLELIFKEANAHNQRYSAIDNKRLQMIEELEELEVEYAQAIYNAERWGDLKDSSDWRTAEVNRIKRVIESKKRIIDTLDR